MNPVHILWFTTIAGMLVSAWALTRAIQETFANFSGRECFPELIWNFIAISSTFIWAPSLSLLIFG